jgi:hypothetical protein
MSQTYVAMPFRGRGLHGTKTNSKSVYAWLQFVVKPNSRLCEANPPPNDLGQKSPIPGQSRCNRLVVNSGGPGLFGTANLTNRLLRFWKRELKSENFIDVSCPRFAKTKNRLRVSTRRSEKSESSVSKQDRVKTVDNDSPSTRFSVSRVVSFGVFRMCFASSLASLEFDDTKKAELASCPVRLTKTERTCPTIRQSSRIGRTRKKELQSDSTEIKEQKRRMCLLPNARQES